MRQFSGVSLRSAVASYGRHRFFTSHLLPDALQITAKVVSGKALRDTMMANISELRNLIEQEKVVRPDSVSLYPPVF